MHSVTHFIDRRTITALAVAAVVSLPASADDIDVYTGKQGTNSKPNILLVLDYSGSMNQDINGNETSVEEDRKIRILKDAVNRLMGDYEHTINLGLGALYDSKPSGVRWPISDLSDHPHFTDSAIPENSSYTMRDIINKQMEQGSRSANGATNTVSALADAALYFQGGPVTHNDASLEDSWYHRPDTWNNDAGEYDGGNPYSALPASYYPNPAYIADAEDGNQTSWCRNYTTYNAAGENYCEGKVTLECNDYPPNNGLWDHDDNPSTPDIVSQNGGFESCKYETNTIWNQPQYLTPIRNECQKNFMILISDGLPTERTEGATLKNVLGIDHDDAIADACLDVSVSTFNNSEKTHGNCGAEILHKMANENQRDGINNSTVSTYTIGFSVDGEGAKYLDDLATAGLGEYMPANNREELDLALAKFIDQFCWEAKTLPSLLLT